MLERFFNMPDVAFLEISKNNTFLENFNRKVNTVNRRMRDSGRKIAEIRLIEHEKTLIRNTIDELSRKCRIVIISGAFGVHGGRTIAGTIAKLFAVPLEISQEAMEVYVNSIGDFTQNGETHTHIGKIYLPRGSIVLHQNGSHHFGFQFANIICCDESPQCVSEICDILHGKLMRDHDFFTRQIIVQPPFEVFSTKIEEIAGQYGCEYCVMRDDGGAYKIIISSPQPTFVEDCEVEILETIADIQGSLKVFT